MKQSPTPTAKVTGPKGIQQWVLVGCGVLLASAVGFHYGQKIVPVELDASAQGQILRTAKIKNETLEVQSLVLSPEISTALPLLAPQAGLPEISAAEKSLKLENTEQLAELEYLNETSSRLRKRVASLEWETLTLESDLLAREVELGKALAEIDRNNRQRKDVYNITNVPIGSYVAPAQSIGAEVVSSPQPTQSTLASTEVSASRQVPEQQNSNAQDTPVTGPVFFGPAPDNYEDRVLTNFAQTPHQEQAQDN